MARRRTRSSGSPPSRPSRTRTSKVFTADNNATMQTMTDPTAFQSICKTVLQKMIEVVPTGVTLSSPIAPYTLKPVDMQLTLNTGGSSLLFTGYIRLRTTNIPVGTS